MVGIGIHKCSLSFVSCRDGRKRGCQCALSMTLRSRGGQGTSASRERLRASSGERQTEPGLSGPIPARATIPTGPQPPRASLYLLPDNLPTVSFWVLSWEMLCC